MSQLDHLLDDALAGFDDDDDDNDGFTFAGSCIGPTPLEAPAVASSVTSSSEPTSEAAAATGAAVVQDQVTASNSLGDGSGSSTAASTGQAPAAASSGTSGGTINTGSSSKPFDPLHRKHKGKAFRMSTAAGLAGASLAGSSLLKASSSSSSSQHSALTPEVHKLQADLAKLMSEWSTAMHPETDEPSQSAAVHQQGAASVLAALAEQTQRTVQEQSKLRAPPGGAAAASSSSSGGEQMNMIVDVVMQHLLSKEVLYQPMKEIMDKYPPWLDKHAGSSSSSLSPADLERYQQQYAVIRCLCQAYEAEPDNTAKIMQLLQEMQACGEPPAEIVEEMSAAIAADLPAEAAAGGGAAAAGGLGLDSAELEALAELPPELRNCPVQ